MGGRSGSGAGGGGGFGSRITQAVISAGGLRRAANQLASDFSNRIGNRLDLTRAAFSGATPAQATAIASGQRKPMGTLPGHTQPDRLPPIKISVHKPSRGPAKLSVTDGRHRLAAAKEAGATRIRANIEYSRTTRSGKTVYRKATKIVQI